MLAIDTATPAITTGLVELADARPRTVSERVSIDPRAHAELLTPQVNAVLAEAGRTLADVGAIVVGVGPGPFTGLRVGMVTAGALGHAAGLPVYPVCTLDAIALDALARRPEPEPLLVATDARRREVYFATYAGDGSRRDEPAVLRPGELPDDLGAGVAAGHGARLYAETIGLPLVEPDFPSPRALVAAASSALRSHAEPGPLTPLYLRRPDAELPAARKKVLR